MRYSFIGHFGNLLGELLGLVSVCGASSTFSTRFFSFSGCPGPLVFQLSNALEFVLPARVSFAGG